MKDVRQVLGYQYEEPSNSGLSNFEQPALKITGKSDKVNGGDLTINLNLKLNEIKNLNDNDFNSNEIDLCLRKIEYCDSDGNKFKMIVLGSQPFSES